MQFCRLLGLSRLVILLTTTALACSSANQVRPLLPNDGKDPSDLARCSVARSQSSPLVTEWPASEKANLESRLREGAVVVAYAGCEMRLLPQCKAGGTYRWNRTTLSEDAIEIRNEDDLYAKLPLGAATLESELRSSGRLTVRTTVAGQLKLDGVATAEIPRTGECEGATHVITGLAVGAFRRMAGGTASAGGGVSVGGVGAGGITLASQTLVRKSGDPFRCAETTDERPSADCQSPIQVFLWPLPSTENTAPLENEGQDAPGALRVNFVLPDADDKWRAMTGDKVLCDLPCTRWIQPGSGVSLRRDGATASETMTLELPKDLGGYSAGREIDALPSAGSPALEVLGVMAFSLGLAATITGTLMWGMGEQADAESDRDTIRPGQAAVGVGIPLFAAGVWMMALDYSRRVDLSLSPSQSASRQPHSGVASDRTARGFHATFSPVGLSGSF